MPEHTLILLRHAKSDWSGEEADVDRPLAKRGRRQAPAIGRWLAANIDGIDLAVGSPAARARSTPAELDVLPPIRIDDRVYAASDQQLLRVVRELADVVKTVLLVGHNPGLGGLAAGHQRADLFADSSVAPDRISAARDSCRRAWRAAYGGSGSCQNTVAGVNLPAGSGITFMSCIGDGSAVYGCGKAGAPADEARP